MDKAYEIQMFERMSGQVIATFLGLNVTENEALARCVKRARDAKRITIRESNALVDKIRHGVESPVIDTDAWRFTVQVREVRTA